MVSLKLVDHFNKTSIYFSYPKTWVMWAIIDLHDYLMFFLINIFIIVIIFLVYCLLYRYKFLHVNSGYLRRYVRNKIEDVNHGPWLEFYWTMIPIVLLFLMGWPSFRVLYAMEQLIDPFHTVVIIGNQWYWTYQYSDFDVTFDMIFQLDSDLFFEYKKDAIKSIETDSYLIKKAGINKYVNFTQFIQLVGKHFRNYEESQIIYDSVIIPEENLPLGYPRLLSVDQVLVLPCNISIRLLVTSADVIHSWALPSHGLKMDAIPGRINQIPFLCNFWGTYWGQCSELCGINHGFMPIEVRVVPFEDYMIYLKLNLAFRYEKFQPMLVNFFSAYVNHLKYVAEKDLYTTINDVLFNSEEINSEEINFEYAIKENLPAVSSELVEKNIKEINSDEVNLKNKKIYLFSKNLVVSVGDAQELFAIYDNCMPTKKNSYGEFTAFFKKILEIESKKTIIDAKESFDIINWEQALNFKNISIEKLNISQNFLFYRNVPSIWVPYRNEIFQSVVNFDKDFIGPVMDVIAESVESFTISEADFNDNKKNQYTRQYTWYEAWNKIPGHYAIMDHHTGNVVLAQIPANGIGVIEVGEDRYITLPVKEGLLVELNSEFETGIRHVMVDYEDVLEKIYEVEIPNYRGEFISIVPNHFVRLKPNFFQAYAPLIDHSNPELSLERITHRSLVTKAIFKYIENNPNIEIITKLEPRYLIFHIHDKETGEYTTVWTYTRFQRFGEYDKNNWNYAYKNRYPSE